MSRIRPSLYHPHIPYAFQPCKTHVKNRSTNIIMYVHSQHPPTFSSDSFHHNPSKCEPLNESSSSASSSSPSTTFTSAVPPPLLHQSTSPPASLRNSSQNLSTKRVLNTNVQ